MTTYLTPGVYFRQVRPPQRLVPQRTDIAGLVGIAERGPLHQPVRLESWRDFQQVFGGFLPYANLAYAVRAFFENGGQICQVVRVADQDAARAASLPVYDYRVDPADPADPADPDTIKEQLLAYRVVAKNPGKWGNGLTISLQAASLAATHHVVIDNVGPRWLAVASVAGFEPGSQVRLTQRGDSARPKVAVATVLRLDPVVRLLQIDQDLVAQDFVLSDPNNPISVQSMEFTLLVLEGGQVVDRVENLAPNPAHRRYAPDRVNEASHLIRLEPGPGDGLPALPLRARPLTGGVDGLRGLNVFDYIGTPQGDKYGLAALAGVDEVGILAIPDLVTRPETQPTPVRAPIGKIDQCDLANQATRIDVAGRVLDGETRQPLAEVTVEASDGIAIYPATTNLRGEFSFFGLYPGNIELLLTQEGYQRRVYRVVSGGPLTIDLTPVDLPPALSDVDIFYAQSAMIMQCHQLRDRFALIDPPWGADGEPLDLSGIQSWRARFDTPFAALYYPWITLRDPLRPDAPQGRPTPPSGHVAGIYAATDLSVGVWRPPANQTLRFVEDLCSSIDDATQGVLNPLGINAIRAFPGRGIRVYGARTMSSDTAWRFVNVRRLMSQLGEALYDGLQWAVFEANGALLRFNLSMVITHLLNRLWRQGAFVGNTAEEAYRVRCDAVTTSPQDEAEGRIIVEVGVAPTVPYEFIVIRLGLTTDELQVSEV